MPTHHTITSRHVTLSVDAAGRLIRLKNLATGSQYVTHPQQAELFRLVVPCGRHLVEFVLGSEQPRPVIQVGRNAAGQVLSVSFRRLVGPKLGRLDISARFIFTLADDSAVVLAQAELDNRSPYAIDEVEFPVIGGIGRKDAGGMELVRLPTVGWDFGGAFHGDVLNDRLPDTGRESDHFVREHDTAMWEDYCGGVLGLDLSTGADGLYFAYHPDKPHDFAIKLERHPKNSPNYPGHAYPAGTPRWLRIWGVHLPRITPGAQWQSADVTIFAHKGDWHAAADLFMSKPAAQLTLAQPPSWMDNFVGWSEVLGKTYLGEVFHDFKTGADKAIREADITGLDLLFFYGHTNLGAEGADFDQSPAEDLGGEKGFVRMLDRLHKRNIRVMVLDHFHQYVNRDVPEYRDLDLERWATRDAGGNIKLSKWWKETVLSCRRLEGPTPEWTEMCIAAPEYQEHYRRHVLAMARRGVDALEMDCFTASRCFSREHGHEPGAELFPIKLDFFARLRNEVRTQWPDFAFIGETAQVRTRTVLDGWYCMRHPTDNGRIQRYVYPGIWQQAVRVGNYAYDAANRALMLGIGIETEIWGLRQFTFDFCPELARYIGQINRIRRKYADILIRGRYRDTCGATVTVSKGSVMFSVMDGGPAGRALILRNPNASAVKAHCEFEPSAGQRLVLCVPGQAERPLRRMPPAIDLPAYRAAVLLALPA